MINAVWQKPYTFGKVISHCGVFANNREGDKFPEMILKSVKINKGISSN
jgi:hypothetical protein